MQSHDPALCNVTNQKKWVNSAKLCGLSNWRVPTMHEMYSLVSFSQNNRLNLDTRYFPLTEYPGNHGFWTDSPSLDGQSNRVITSEWLSASMNKNNRPNLLMLVSDGFYTDNN